MMCDRSADCLANQIIWSLAGDFYVLLKLKQVFADFKKKKKKKEGEDSGIPENTTERLGVEYSHAPFVSD